MTDASGPAYYSLLLSSRFRKDDRLLYCSNIATNIVESLPGIWGKWGEGRRYWLVHELDSAFVIICGELQSNHFIDGGGEF